MERWLPRGFQVDNAIHVGRILFSGSDWQLYAADNGGYVLAVSSLLHSMWSDISIIPVNLFEEKTTAAKTVWVSHDTRDNLIASVKHGPYPQNAEDARAFALALKRSRDSIPERSFSDALYFERFSLVLPTNEEYPMDDQTVLCRWLASGVEIAPDRFDRLCKLVSWMSPDVLADVIRDAGFVVSQGDELSIEMKTTQKAEEGRRSDTGKPNPSIKRGDRFSLPGRPTLEAFFNEHVIDIIQNIEKYKRMGIGFPGAVILYGPPGCGKTYAVERLVEFLGWPSFSIDSGSIGSPYIHDTSKKISEMFDKAIDNAPSVLVIDEMEAFLSARELSQGSGQHHVEEVAEFLRRIPDAISKNVLVFAMTNLIDSIDPAILRRGRFDHIIEVQMPSKEEVEALLRHLLSALPSDDDIDFDMISSRLAGHAMSDVTFVIKEAGRIAVKQNEETINNRLILEATELLPKEKSTRKIGF